MGAPDGHPVTGPHPALARVRAAVRADLDTLLANLPADAAPAVGPPLVLVACSGGPDSLALAAALAFVAPRRGVRAGAVVVDHGLQAGSDRVAARAAEQCRDLGLGPVEVIPVEVRAGGGPEAAARAARHTALAEAADRHGAVAVLLGHTLDDQAETVLLGLARGSGARSLAGMAAVRGRLRRPLLGISRAIVHEACAAAGLVAWTDPTNAPGGNRRADVRHRVLPVLAEVLGPGVPEALARTAGQLREDGEALDALADELLRRAGSTGGSAPTGGSAGLAGPTGAGLAGPTGAGLDAAVLAVAPTAVRRRALRAALIAWGCPPGSLAATHVQAVDALVSAWSGQGPVHAPGVTVSRRCGRLTPGIPT